MLGKYGSIKFSNLFTLNILQINNINFKNY